MTSGGFEQWHYISFNRLTSRRSHAAQRESHTIHNDTPECIPRGILGRPAISR